MSSRTKKYEWLVELGFDVYPIETKSITLGGGGELYSKYMRLQSMLRKCPDKDFSRYTSDFRVNKADISFAKRGARVLPKNEDMFRTADSMGYNVYPHVTTTEMRKTTSDDYRRISRMRRALVLIRNGNKTLSDYNTDWWGVHVKGRDIVAPIAKPRPMSSFRYCMPCINEEFP